MKKNKKNPDEPIVIKLNLSLTVITIIVICILAAAITGVKVITTMISANKSETLVSVDENPDIFTWVDSTETDENGELIKVPIPKGYTASQIDGETTVSGGFVIYEGNIDWSQIEQTEANIFQLQSTVNQWVWVPVEDISEIYGVDEKGKLWGKLYQFPYVAEGSRAAFANSWTETDEILEIASETTYQEPNVIANLSAYDTDYNLQSYLDGKTRVELLREMEELFYQTVKSIKTYGGFYIGRYETGGLSSSAVVQKMNTDITNQTWYVMYEKCKDLNGVNDNVITSMIWGSLWDATLEWFVDSKATTSAGEQITYPLISYSSALCGNYYDSSFTYITADGNVETTAEKTSVASAKIPAGSTDFTKINNIYDMAGNVGDRTLENSDTSNRIYRGATYIDTSASSSAAIRNDGNPGAKNGNIGCRAILLIK